MYKKMKYIIMFLFVSIFYSCGSSKTVTVYKEKTKIDTIYSTIVKEIEKPIHDSINVVTPCKDGVLKPFDKIIKNNKVKVRVFNNNGNISVKIDVDSLYRVWEKTKQLKFETNLQTKETKVVKYRATRYTWYFLLWAIIATALLFRKKIPYMKLLPF